MVYELRLKGAEDARALYNTLRGDHLLQRQGFAQQIKRHGPIVIVPDDALEKAKALADTYKRRVVSIEAQAGSSIPRLGDFGQTIDRLV